ncbi:hypothetical protein [Polaribacter sp. Asnod1-A03]|uniref:hypothetical protein n=1 Tax=Polaribacter sp. Asnod1-A03 TaxID=3160581 RepID=UPI0038650F89
MERSKYVSTENLNITYLFGAGSSFNSVPIWNKQGETMILIGEWVNSLILNVELNRDKDLKVLFKNSTIKRTGDKLIELGYKALEFGTLDIYARSLFLLDEKEKLNNLKYHLRVYFDIWENFYYKKSLINKEKRYSKIDKRYYSLLSVLLEKGKLNPELNSNVSFVSWNYDLQLENSFRSFMRGSENTNLESVNKYFNFFESNENQDIIHLNGFRGFFNCDKKLYPNVEPKFLNTIEDYLFGLLNNSNQFSSIDYSNNIKYAWETNSEALSSAIEVFEKTNILIVIGYSFPSYNRLIDSRLITSLGSKAINKGIKEVIYQNPNANLDLIKNICGVKPVHFQNTDQFYIPHEFLFPQKAPEMFF